MKPINCLELAETYSNLTYSMATQNLVDELYLVIVVNSAFNGYSKNVVR